MPEASGPVSGGGGSIKGMNLDSGSSQQQQPTGQTAAPAPLSSPPVMGKQAESLTAKMLQRLNPLNIGYGAHRTSKGKERHEQMKDAIKHGYPAGWVSLGMRPRR